MNPLSAIIDIFFHYRLFEILFLETWAKGHIMRQVYKLRVYERLVD